jgi:hypothetical protein
MMHSISASRDSIDVGTLRRIFLADDSSPATKFWPLSITENEEENNVALIPSA